MLTGGKSVNKMMSVFLKYVSVVCLLLLPARILYSQSREVIDSLKKNLSDTSFVSKHPDKQIIKDAIVVSDYYSRIRLDSAKYYAYLAFEFSKRLNNETGKAISLNAIGMSYTSAGYYDSASPFLDSSLAIFEKLKDTTGITFVKNNLAVVNMRRGNYVKAVELYQKNLEYAQKQNNFENMLLAYNNLGIVFYDWQKYDEALENYNKALEVLNLKGEEDRKGSVYNNIGEIYRKKGELSQAKKYFEKSLEINSKYGKKRSILISISNLGEIYFQQKKYEKALENFKKALAISYQIPDNYNVAIMNVDVGKTLNKLGKPGQAGRYLQEGIKVAQTLGLKNILIDAYKALMENAKLENNATLLYEYTKKYIALKDSVFNEKSMKTLNELETRFKTAQKEKEIAELTADQKAKALEIQVQRNQKYFLAITLLVILFVTYLLFNRYRIKQIKIKTGLEKARISIEQRLFRSQMNPHFIFNSLNSISSFIGSNNSSEAQLYLAKFAKLMRLILENSRKSSIALEDEIQALQLNLELEKLRFDNRFDFKISVADDIDPENMYISPMLIQPFIENSIKHGFKNKKEKGFIKIDFVKENGMLVCTVEDNGIGRKAAAKNMEAKNKRHVSLGTEVTKDRFSILKNINVQAGFEIIDLTDEEGNPTGTKVIIKIPFEEE
jgi:tetratricopeptide (TPR) repeat protein